MKHSLLLSAALAALALPLAMPTAAMAQNGDGDRPSRPHWERSSDSGNVSGAVERPRFAERERPVIARGDDASSGPATYSPRVDRGDRRPDRDGSRDRPRRDTSSETPSSRPSEEQGGRWNRDRNGGQERPNRPRPDQSGGADGNRGGWNRGDRGGANRGDWSRDNNRDRNDRNGWNRPGNGGWNGSGNGGWNNDRPASRPQDRERTRREWRAHFNGDQWRRDFYRDRSRDWWRNDHRFRGYTGLRIGFYFAPGYGYYSVPRSYWGRDYQVGGYLPSIFWRYSLNDWRTYGLGIPPAGTRWVLVDNNIYLIDEYDGYIIDVVYDAWAW